MDFKVVFSEFFSNFMLRFQSYISTSRSKIKYPSEWKQFGEKRCFFLILIPNYRLFMLVICIKISVCKTIPFWKLGGLFLRSFQRDSEAAFSPGSAAECCPLEKPTEGACGLNALTHPATSSYHMVWHAVCVKQVSSLNTYFSESLLEKRSSVTNRTLFAGICGTQLEKQLLPVHTRYEVDVSH